MGKFKICEILGVDIETPFEYETGSYKIDKDGTLLAKYCDGSDLWYVADGVEICEIINNGIPKWTDKEIENAKVLKRVFDTESQTLCLNHDLDGKLYITDEKGSYLPVNSSSFPSACRNIKRNQSVTLDAIIREGEES